MNDADTLRLPSLLARDAVWDLRLDAEKTDDLKTAARFWLPTKPPTTRAGCETMLARVFAAPAELTRRFADLSDTERAILAVFKRYGGAMSGELLRTELMARNLDSLDEKTGGYPFYKSSRSAPFSGLLKKYLIHRMDRQDRHSYHSYASGNRYPNLVANPVALHAIPAAEQAPWQPDCGTPAPTDITRGSFAEVVWNLWAVAQELARNHGWKPTRAGTVPKALANKLRKVLPPPNTDSPAVPDLPVLYCELLGGCGATTTTEVEGHVDLGRVQELLDTEAEPLASMLVKAWRGASVWQDGSGALDYRDDHLLTSLLSMREILLWGLGAIARGRDDWFNTGSFLRQLWEVQQGDTPHFYSGDYDWTPAFAQAYRNANLTGAERPWASWVSGAGTCCANAILGTFVHLGLVERGPVPVAGRGPLAFRLTTMGRVVFGSPDVTGSPPAAESRFFTVQSNYDVVVFPDGAPPSAIWPLARFARRTSGSGQAAHTFAFNRETVYHAMEGGFGNDRIREYLTAHARNVPPQNVIRTLDEWGGKRDSLVLRRGLTLLVGVTSPPKNARAVGEGFHLLDGTAKVEKGVPTVTYPDAARPCGTVNEHGVMRFEPDADLVARSRWRQLIGIAEGGELQVTSESVAAARKRGQTVDQLLTRLRHHHRGPVPPVLEVAIRNWDGGGQVGLGIYLMLRVPDAIVASALLQSERFKPLFLHHIPPEWFVVDGRRRKELEKLLAGIGFTWTTDI